MVLKKSKKNIVQDVVPPKRSIRNVELPSRAREKSGYVSENVGEAPKLDKFSRSVNIKKTSFDPPAPVKELRGVEADKPIIIKDRMEDVSVGARAVPPFVSEAPTKKIPNYSYEYEKPTKNSKVGLYIAIVIFVLAAAFGVSALFKSASIRITPKHQSVNFSETLTVKKNAVGMELGYQVVTVTKDAEQTVPATGEKKVEAKASGKIVIFNKGATAQKLIATTRFETPEGLVFRLNQAVTVPAKKSATVAGSVEAAVTADATGNTYNVGLKDFTLPALKGTPKYSEIFARSKTAMTGGFSGMQKTVSPENVSQAEGTLEETLRDGLAKDITSQIPSNFVLYPGSILYSFEPARQMAGTSSSAVLLKKGTASAVIFDRGALTRVILSKVLATTTKADDMIKITNLDSFAFSYDVASSTSASTFPTLGETLRFSLEGTANAVWIFDAEKLKLSVLGLSKTDAKTVLSKHTALEEAWIQTQPFWNSTIPVNPKKVTLVNTLENSE